MGAAAALALDGDCGYSDGEGEVMTREATTRLLEMVDEGMLDRDTVIMACVKYMSEDDIADMCRINGFDEDDEDDED